MSVQTQHTQSGSTIKLSEKVNTQYGIKVAIDVPYEVKDEFKKALDWNATHRTWNSRHDSWTVDEKSITYVKNQLTDKGFNVVNLIN
jgi:hypothetical protein